VSDAGAGEAVLRLFVAIVPRPHEAARLAELAAALRHGGRAVPAANLHLTLAFLGGVAQARVPAIEAALATVTGEAFALELRKVGHFPRPRVLWCACVPAPAALYRLQGRVAHVLGEAGLALEARAFTPHVTVARKVARYRGPAELPRPVIWSVRELCLLRSRTLPEGARYEPLRAYGLQR